MTYDTPLGEVDLPPVSPPLPPLEVATCKDALGWWITAQCTAASCCGSLTDYPLKLLILRHRCGDARLLDVAARLRCKRCRGKPSCLRLVDDVQRMPSAHSGRPPGGGIPATVVELLPLLAAEARRAGAA